MWTRTGTALDQDCETESNCVKKYTVQCRQRQRQGLHRKQVTLSRVSQLQKKCLSHLEIDSSQSETALCSAVLLAQSGTDAIVPLDHGQYLGTSGWTACQSPLGASQHARKKNTRKRDRILNVVCPVGSSRQTRNRMLRRSLSLVAHKTL